MVMISNSNSLCQKIVVVTASDCHSICMIVLLITNALRKDETVSRWVVLGKGGSEVRAWFSMVLLYVCSYVCMWHKTWPQSGLSEKSLHVLCTCDLIGRHTKDN